jgi:hypothetical protein
MSTVTSLQRRILTIEQQIGALNVQLDALFRAGGTAQAEEIGARIDGLNIELQDLRQQLITAQQVQSLPIISSGKIARDDAVATVDRTQTPLTDPQVLSPDGRIVTASANTSGTTALPAVTDQDVDTGTNAPVRTISQTQATPVGPGLVQDPGDADAQAGGFYGGGVAPATTQIGAGAGSEDAGNRNLTRVEIDNIFTETNITPRPNVLDQYASYTYVASVYLVPAEQYKQMMETKRKNLTSSALLFQSGGAPVSGRNPYFTNDYYIDRFEIKSFITGQGTGMTHNAKDINMTVVEPNGITLIDNLTRAVQSFFPDPQKKKDITSVIYLMVVRFYGYDENGNLVRGGVSRPDGSSDPNAFVEKWYPFIIKDIKFKVANKLVEYDISAAAPHYQINAGVARGTIPFNIELSGQTIKDLLSGPVQYGGNQTAVAAGSNAPNTNLVGTFNYGTGEWEQAPAPTVPVPPKANAAPSPKTTIRQGLMAALNEHQKSLVDGGKQQYADEYNIEFVGAANAPSAIEQAKLRPPGGLNKSATSMAVPKTAADAKLGSKQSMDPNARTQSATAGMQIVQFLDQVLRNSTYLKDQQLVEVDENTGQVFFNGTPAQNVAWFKISLEATAMLDKWDTQRKQYAYKIKYIISPYRLSQLNSKYFPTPKFTGVQKEYKYWFTGENSQVLSYEENINGLYYLTLSGANFNLNADILNETGEQIKYNFQTNSSESSQGADGQTNEIVANAAEQLLQPGSVKEANVTIVGDPAWLQQGEGSLGQLRNQWNFGSFFPDGTLNFDGGQILFRIAFNAPADYSPDNGIMRPGLASSVAPGPAQGSATGPAQINRVYIATKVTSSFVKGKFTQQLTGSLLLQQTTADNQAALATAINQQQQAISGMSSNRQPTGALLLSNLSTPSYAAGGIAQTLGITSGVNFSQQGQNLLASYTNSVLGGAATRPFAVPQPPTSSGLPVGLVNTVFQAPSRLIAGATNTITNTVNQVLSSSERNVRGVLDSVSTGATQQVAASDDSGIGLVQSPIAETAYVSPAESGLISEPPLEFNVNNDFFG